MSTANMKTFLHYPHDNRLKRRNSMPLTPAPTPKRQRPNRISLDHLGTITEHSASDFFAETSGRPQGDAQARQPSTPPNSSRFTRRAGRFGRRIKDSVRPAETDMDGSNQRSASLLSSEATGSTAEMKATASSHDTYNSPTDEDSWDTEDSCDDLEDAIEAVSRESAAFGLGQLPAFTARDSHAEALASRDCEKPHATPSYGSDDSPHINDHTQSLNSELARLYLIRSDLAPGQNWEEEHESRNTYKPRTYTADSYKPRTYAADTYKPNTAQHPKLTRTQQSIVEDLNDGIFGLGATSLMASPYFLSRLRSVRGEELSTVTMAKLYESFKTDEEIELLGDELSEEHFEEFKDYVRKTRAPSEQDASDQETRDPLVGPSSEKLEKVFPDGLPARRDLTKKYFPWMENVNCYVCHRTGHSGQDCNTCQTCRSKWHDYRNCPKTPKFHKFMDLPAEVRERIFEEALYTGQPIKPHLCDARIDGKIKFHDDNQKGAHGGISKLLGITRVSKQIRAESLPCFYSANTFVVANDTATYFMRLNHIRRFRMVRNVQFEIRLRKEFRGAETLQHMNKHIKDVEAYEAAAGRAPKNHAYYKAHPVHIDGGELALFICLRMLTSRFTSNPYTSGAGQGYTSKLVLPIPAARIFSDYAALGWFPVVCHGLGIHLHYLEGRELSYNAGNVMGITWRQAYQKKDFKDKVEVKGEDVKGRILEMFPEVGPSAETGGTLSYMRTSCDRQSYEWFRVLH
jgi:hypothetical protein